MSLFEGSADVEAPRKMAPSGPSASKDTTWPCPPPCGSSRDPTPSLTPFLRRKGDRLRDRARIRLGYAVCSV